jgi:integrase/recombinase XerD
VLEVLYSTAKGHYRVSHCWLRQRIDSYLGTLHAQRFKNSTLRVYANQLLSFAEFLAQQGIGDVSELPQWIDPFVCRFHPRKPSAGIWRSLLTRFVCNLIQQGIVPTPPPAVAICPHANLVAEYAQFLLEHRGICRRRIQHIRRCTEELLLNLGLQGVVDLKSLGSVHIHAFIIREGQRVGRITLGHRCTMIRGFLSHLHRRGITSIDLSQAVVSPRRYQHEQCPRFLTRAEVEAVLAAVDLQTPHGRRDYAMLLLLAVYGLRGIEVIRLRLDDIDWRKQVLFIRRRKAGNNTAYPLAVSVGEAIVSYLQYGRPQSPHREVFLSTLAPFAPLADPAPMRMQVRKCLAKAGVRVDRPGTHTFRYSCAQQLLEQGMPLKSIGDYLGHSSPSSTQWYTKIAIEQLRDVASGDAEDLL